MVTQLFSSPFARTALDSVLLRLFRLCKIADTVESYPLTRWRVEGAAWLLITLALAIFVPEISYVIHPIGGLAATFIFIFPGQQLPGMMVPTVFSLQSTCRHFH